VIIDYVNLNNILRATLLFS